MESTGFGVPFRGKRIIHPGAYDYIDGSAMTITSGTISNIPIVIGTAEAGKPGELVWLTAEEAREYLRGGELLTAVQLMSSPIPEGGGGANTIGIIVANENTRATSMIGGVQVSSLEYGTGGNKVQAKLENGAITGSKKFTAYRWDLDLMEVFDNVGAVMEIKYIGGSEYAEIAITEGGLGEKTLETKIGTDKSSAVVDVSIALHDEQFETIGRVVNYFNSISGYEASIVSEDSSTLESIKLDVMVGTPIKAITPILALKGDIEHRINNGSRLVSVAVSGSVSNSSAFKYLTGGSEGTVPISWVNYFDKCKSSFSDMLVLLTEDESIHAEGLAHMDQMEQRGQRQVMFTGGGIGETPDKAIKRAKALNHSRAISAYPGIYHRLIGKGKTKLPAYMTAAMIAGRVAGVSPSEPVTFDYFSVVGLVNNLVAGDPVIDNLLSAGVCTFEKVQNGGVRLVQGITTYTSLNNSLYREISVRRGADILSNNVRKALEETFVGKKGLSTTETSVKTVTMDELDKAVANEEIVAYDPKSIVVRFVNSVVFVDYMVAAIEPINFVLITSHFVPNTQL